MEAMMTLDVEQRSKLVNVAYTRGLRFVAAEVKLHEDVILAAAKGVDCPELDAKKIGYWLKEFVL